LHILDIRPEHGGSGNTIARFDVQLTPHCRLFNLKLVRARSGDYRVYAPSAWGSNTATFAPELAADLVRAAGDALKGKPIDQRAA